MARPRAFDETDVVAAAQDRFWSFGYAATSLDDLVKATGLSKGSIYNTFSDKHTLYLRTFERYCDDIVAQVATHLDGPDETAAERAARAVRRDRGHRCLHDSAARLFPREGDGRTRCAR